MTTLPGQKIGKRWRFHKDAVDAWVKNTAFRPHMKAGVSDGRT